jgi:peptidoglycan/LPS O-acetylase OafA/YrhL
LTRLRAHRPTPPAGSSTVENIQALRGIAALLVVVAHLSFPMSVLCFQAGQLASPWMNYGASGVDIFFVISGYVICLTASKRHHRAVDFIRARLARVSPLYLVLTVIAMGRWLFIPGPGHLFQSIWNGIFYLPIFDIDFYNAPPVFVGWTLSYEMCFYCAFALLLLLWPPRSVAVLLPIFFAVGVALTLFYYRAAWVFPRFLFDPIVLEFAFGCLVFHLQRHLAGAIPRVLLGVALALIPLAMGDSGWFGPALGMLHTHFDPEVWRVISWGIPAACIVAGCLGLERDRGLVLPGVLIWLGEISYSLYLTHFFSMMVAAEAGKRLGIHAPVLVIVISLAAAIAGAWICWKWLEQPLTTRAQKWARALERSAAPPESAAPQSA